MKILIAEQDSDVRNQIKEILRLNLKQGRLAQFIEDGDGKRAFASLLLEKPDLAFLDLHLPDIGGLQLLSKMNEFGNKSISPRNVILIANTSDKQVVVSLIEKGIKNVIIKPLDIEVLIKKTEHVLESANQELRE